MKNQAFWVPGGGVGMIARLKRKGVGGRAPTGVEGTPGVLGSPVYIPVIDIPACVEASA